MKFVDYTGNKIDYLTVVKRAEDRYTKSGQKVIQWYCKCDCGNENLVIKSSSTLADNSIFKSCGCMHRKLLSASKRKKLNNNKYDLNTYDFGVGFNNKGYLFVFDKEDYDLVKQYSWRKRKDGYFDAKLCDGTNRRIMMHDLIMNGKYFDHINNDVNDNRKINLRPSSNLHSFDTYNQMNKKIQSNNKSGYRGVSWHTRDNVWEAHISIDNKVLYLGRYSDFKEAVKVRQDAEKKYFADWSYDKEIVEHVVDKINIKYEDLKEN